MSIRYSLPQGPSAESRFPSPHSPNTAVRRTIWVGGGTTGSKSSSAPSNFQGLELRGWRSASPPVDMVLLVTLIHIAVCFFLIVVILLQSGKSGDLAAAFGGQGSQTAFGPRGAATALSKATTWSTVLFMITSITLSVFAARSGGAKSVLSGVKPSTTKSQPVTPVTPPPSQSPTPAK